MNSSGLVQGEALLMHDKRNIQVFYEKPPAANFLAIVSTGLGRTNDITRLPKWLEYLSEAQQYGVLLYNYPGQGKTSVRDSKFSQAEQMVLDLEYLLKAAQVEGWPLSQIYFLGISIGTGPTMQLLKKCREEYRGVILFSPYKTPKDLFGIDDELKAFFGCDTAHIRGLDSSEAMKEVAIQSIHRDITIVVGMEDTTIGPEHGADLYRLLQNTRHTTRLIRMNGASHAAVRTAAKDYIQLILKDPKTVNSGEESYNVNP